MKKKFKTRIVYFGHNKYKIQYCYYHFIPIWKTIEVFLEFNFDNGLYYWNPELLTMDKAERFARSFKSIEDIKKHYEIENKKEKFFLEKRKKYLDSIVRIKNINQNQML